MTPSSTCGLGTVYLPVDGLIDVESEQARLSRQLEKIEAGLRQIDGKLSNDNVRLRDYLSRRRRCVQAPLRRVRRKAPGPEPFQQLVEQTLSLPTG